MKSEVRSQRSEVKEFSTCLPYLQQRLGFEPGNSASSDFRLLTSYFFPINNEISNEYQNYFLLNIAAKQ